MIVYWGMQSGGQSQMMLEIESWARIFVAFLGCKIIPVFYLFFFNLDLYF